METKQLEPAEIIRSEMGTWTHPEYAEYLADKLKDAEYISRDEWGELKRHFNIQTVTFWMEGHVSPDDWETMMDDCDITKWNPIAREDDAYALFARNKRESEVA